MHLSKKKKKTITPNKRFKLFDRFYSEHRVNGKKRHAENSRIQSDVYCETLIVEQTSLRWNHKS